MSFFKNLFSREGPFVPTPTQSVPGLDPMIVYAIELLFPNIEEQKKVFDYSIKFLEGKKGDDVQLLAVLAWSEGKLEGLTDLNSPNLESNRFWMEVMMENFSTMKGAKKWVRSLAKSQKQER